MAVLHGDRVLWRPVIYNEVEDRAFWSQTVMFSGRYLQRHFLRCVALAFNNKVALNAAWDAPSANEVEGDFGDMIAPDQEHSSFVESLGEGEWGELDQELFNWFYDAWANGLTQPPV